MRFISWNVNGLRAVLKKGLISFIKSYNPDILGIQETKLGKSQIPKILDLLKDYEKAWNFANKKGYSGTAVFYKKDLKPVHIKTEFEHENLSKEGRIIEIQFQNFTFFNIYFPNGQANEIRLKYKLDFYNKSLDYFKKLRGKKKKLIIAGDFNTAHRNRDIFAPQNYFNRSGFLPIEREWINNLIKAGFLDSFRLFNNKSNQFTWWPYWNNARKNNRGWRIDYFFISKELSRNILNSYILNDVYGSDHCPIGLETSFE